MFTLLLLVTFTRLVFYHFYGYKLEIENITHNSTNIKTTKISNINPCYNEWSLLNEDVYFRRNLAFYYKDINKIRLFYFRRKSHKNLTIEILIRIRLKDSLFTNSRSLKSIKYSTIHQYSSYSFESLETEFVIAIGESNTFWR